MTSRREFRTTISCCALICWRLQIQDIGASDRSVGGQADPQNERKKSAKRAPKNANERNLKKCSFQLTFSTVSVHVWLHNTYVPCSCRFCSERRAMSKESLEQGLKLLRQQTTESCQPMDAEIEALCVRIK